MFTMKYALESGGSKDLGLQWANGAQALKILYSGKLVAVCPKDKLNPGTKVKLPDGSTLKVRYELFRYYLTRNEKPIPGSASHPLFPIVSAYQWIRIFGFLCLVMGIFTSPWDFAKGLLFLGLAYFLARGSIYSLGVALLFQVYSLVLANANFIQTGNYWFGISIISNLWIIVDYLSAMITLHELKKTTLLRGQKIM